MVYDPFGSDSHTTRRKLVSVRKPPLCDVELTPLEWSDGRKRRPEQSQANSHSQGVSHRTDRADDGPSARGSTDNVREVVRVVEKVVNAEPTTIMGVPPLVDDRIRYVVNFILEHVRSPNVEVEAKLGLLIEKEQDMRAIHLVPVTCETPISAESNKDTRFQSDVGEAVFMKLNEKLNARVEETLAQEDGRVQYQQTREMDLYWPGRIRETKALRKASDGSEVYETIRVQSKRRLGDLNMLCPGRIADIRYSASLEEDCRIPNNASPQMQRIKDRISYKYEYLSIDITSVDMHNAGSSQASRTYEVEVEIDPSADLYGEVTKYRNADDTSKLFDIAASLVNTVRLLLED